MVRIIRWRGSPGFNEEDFHFAGRVFVLLLEIENRRGKNVLDNGLAFLLGADNIFESLLRVWGNNIPLRPAKGLKFRRLKRCYKLKMYYHEELSKKEQKNEKFVGRICIFGHGFNRCAGCWAKQAHGKCRPG
ncbi:MAG: hypothetical protein LBC81_05380 [Tannerellaceae bacterium]|jgi:hypothetical protein|nr:hypothetical protein [Tannerellaceae bacterium]